MARIAGIQVKKDASGRPQKLIIDIKKHPALTEDLLDIIEAEKHRQEPTTPLSEVIAEMDKKYGVKRDRNV